jgi:hypothetical protein
MDHQPRLFRRRPTGNSFDGTAARQLDLLDGGADPYLDPPVVGPRVSRPRSLRLLQKDVYAELARRRRRAQVRARHVLDRT